MTELRDHAVAFAWGAAEATVFFVVPDVWLTRVATRDPGRAARTCGSAVAGALVGGAATWAWARRTPPARSRGLLRRLPAISGAMVDRVDAEVAARGAVATLSGPARGVPYKLYARAAGLHRSPLATFLAWSVPARTPRFLLVVGLAAGLTRLSERTLGAPRTRRLAGPLHAAAWTAFYAWYFRTVGREAPRLGA